MEDNNDYEKALSTAHAELTALLIQHEALEKRIAKLRQIVGMLATLTELTEDDDDEPSELEIAARAELSGDLALTDSIREVLKASGKPMRSVDVRRDLRRMGVDTEKYTNALAVIHRALKRLFEQGEVRQGISDEGKKTYQWKGFFLEPRPMTRKERRLATEAEAPQLLTRRQIRHAKEAAEKDGGKLFSELWEKAAKKKD